MMSRPAHFRTLLGAILISGMCIASAQGAPGKADAKPAAAAQGKEQDKPKEPEKPKTIDELTKDFTKMEGLVTLYRQTKDKKDTVYMEIPEGRLEKLMLIQITSGSGMGDTSAFVYHGMPINDIAVKFHRVDENKIQLLSPNLGYRGNTAESKRGIARSFPDAIMSTFEIAAKQDERKSMLIDVSSFFKSDVGDLSTAVDSFALDPSGSRIDTVKDFPENFVVHTVYQLQRKGPANGDPKSVPWAVSFNISDLPVDNGYRPRLGDPRVGYFSVAFQDLTDAQQGYDPYVNYIQRWNLQKADPSLAVSPPKKPIVFYVDNAVPQEYRDAVRKGILFYNEAFEKIGIKDAIEVRQMPEDADWDIADIRYNVVRWTTGMPFAIALFRSNPLTGEILNACVNMDAGFASAGSARFDDIIDPGSRAARILNPEANDSAIPAALRDKWSARLCDMQERGRMVQARGFAAAEVLTPGFTEVDRMNMVNEYITEVVSHEVGHCMGLRHNFAASNQLTMKDLCDPAMVNKYGTTASVMDYTPFNAGAIGRRDVPYFSPRIGTYDFWAIEYGYTPIDAATPEGEIGALRKIASLGSTPGHLYQSDGSADDFDPYVVRFDNARQPLDYLTTLSELGPKIQKNAYTRIRPGDSYYKFTRAWMAGLSSQINNALDASAFIGGGRLSTSFDGDPNGRPGYVPVDAPTQRRALTLMTKMLFSEDSFDISKKDLNKLTFNPKSPNNEVGARSRMFPVQQQLALAGRGGLLLILNADTLSRMKTNEFRAGAAGNTLSVAELFHTLDKTVWSEVDSNRPVSDLRRELQRSYLDIMIPMALGQARGVPNDARDLAMDNLVSLRHRITVDMPTAKDAYTGAHLRQSLSRINRALEAQTMVPVGQ